MFNDDLHRILLKGGVTSPGELKDYLTMLEGTGLKEVFFGSRQDILFPLFNNELRDLKNYSKISGTVISNRSYQNIVCSYVSADIFDMTYWLKGSTYLYILEDFNYLPKLKINITDPKQRLVPIFGGNLNFIASEEEDFWYLNIQLPNWKKSEYYPVLIYSWDIVTIAKTIEDIYEGINSIEQLFSILSNRLQTNNRIPKKPLTTSFLTFPYYEGMNRMGIDQYWLGLYWRNNKYDIGFLKDFCGFCLDNSIGKICLTPWKSFIVKGIRKESRQDLEKFLGQRGINVRHSQLEMNWHLPVDDIEALSLKKKIVNEFDENDISTYGLTFAISNDVGKKSHFSAVIIEKNKISDELLKLDIKPTYNVLYYKDFDPNTGVLERYAQEVDKSQLSPLLIELSKQYFNQLYIDKETKTAKNNLKKERTQLVFQCTNCLTIYDDQFGDLKANISSKTKFIELPDSYCCSVCDSPKTVFKEVQMSFNDLKS